MRIKEFSIRQYGPLKDTGRIPLENFNLFYGKNEDGKSLLIDSLVKILIGRDLRLFEKIDRVEDYPDGYIIIQNKDKEWKLAPNLNMTDIIDIGPLECRNIFIIRNSDLSMAKESNFYRDITVLLTGLRTEEITSIKEKLKELGRLTRADSNADLSDDRRLYGDLKIKSRTDKAKKLIQYIGDLQDNMVDAGFDELELEISDISEKIWQIEQELLTLESARKREKYEKSFHALETLKNFLEKFKELDLDIFEKIKVKLGEYLEKKNNSIYQNLCKIY